MTRSIDATPKRIALALGSVILFLFVMNLIVIYLHFVKGHEHLRGFMHAFYFDNEANFPSLYSSVAIFGCSVLLWIIGSLSAEKQHGRSVYWKSLSFIFAFLALDEFASLHESLIRPVKKLIEGQGIDAGFLYFAWLVPYTLAVVVLAIVLFRFVVKLPGQTRLHFLIGGGLFLAGAIVMEMIGGNYWAGQGWSVYGTDKVDVRYALIVSLEELLEMLGILVFAYGLLMYYVKNSPPHTLIIKLSGKNGADSGMPRGTGKP